MKRWAFVLVITTTIFSTAVAPALAADNSAEVEQTYLSKLDTYRSSITNWQTALQKYKDFNTLTAESAAISAAKTYLTNSIDLIMGYLEILVQKASNTESISSTDKDYINNFYKAEKAYFANQQKSVNTSQTREQVKAVGKDLNDHVNSETIPTVPLVKNLITVSQYKEILDNLSLSFTETRTLAQNQNFLGKPTQDLINNWFTDTEDKLENSESLLKTVITDLRSYKDGTITGYDQVRVLARIAQNVKTLSENMVNHANNILEILGRLKNG